tara:strand:+ start:389 stop:784 length:396 start_codon:yes stop_codon:yes gene_type:complete
MARHIRRNHPNGEKEDELTQLRRENMELKEQLTQKDSDKDSIFIKFTKEIREKDRDLNAKMAEMREIHNNAAEGDKQIYQAKLADEIAKKTRLSDELAKKTEIIHELEMMNMRLVNELIKLNRNKLYGKLL